MRKIPQLNSRRLREGHSRLSTDCSIAALTLVNIDTKQKPNAFDLRADRELDQGRSTRHSWASMPWTSKAVAQRQENYHAQVYEVVSCRRGCCRWLHRDRLDLSVDREQHRSEH